MVLERPPQPPQSEAPLWGVGAADGLPVDEEVAALHALFHRLGFKPTDGDEVFAELRIFDVFAVVSLRALEYLHYFSRLAIGRYDLEARSWFRDTRYTGNPDVAMFGNVNPDAVARSKGFQRRGKPPTTSRADKVIFACVFPFAPPLSMAKVAVDVVVRRRVLLAGWRTGKLDKPRRLRRRWRRNNKTGRLLDNRPFRQRLHESCDALEPDFIQLVRSLPLDLEPLAQFSNPRLIRQIDANFCPPPYACVGSSLTQAWPST